MPDNIRFTAPKKKMIPMRRFGDLREVVEPVLFLASDKASYITGSVIEVNGGL